MHESHVSATGRASGSEQGSLPVSRLLWTQRASLFASCSSASQVIARRVWSSYQISWPASRVHCAEAQCPYRLRELRVRSRDVEQLCLFAAFLSYFAGSYLVLACTYVRCCLSDF